MITQHFKKEAYFKGFTYGSGVNIKVEAIFLAHSPTTSQHVPLQARLSFFGGIVGLIMGAVRERFLRRKYRDVRIQGEV